MLAKAVAASACLLSVASAFTPSAFQPRLRSTGVTMQMDRREAVTAGAAAAAIAPFLASSPASAERPAGTAIVPKTKTFLSSNFYAPEITVFDHRGCNRAPKEYKGAKTGTQDDEMLVRVKSTKVFVPEEIAAKVLQEVLPSIAKTCPAANANMCN